MGQDVVDGGPQANWLSQVKRGLLELCILHLLRRQAMYGYQIVKRITAMPGMAISEGTIYPLLSRLKTQGMIRSSLVESPQGPARRTYVLTDAGERHLEAIHEAWRSIVHAVDLCNTPFTPPTIEPNESGDHRECGHENTQR